MATPACPKRLRDILDPTYRHARQVHLDQRLLDRALAPSVTLDDRRLNVCARSFGNLQPHLARLGLQLALVAAGARVPRCLAAFLAAHSTAGLPAQGAGKFADLFWAGVS